MDSVHSFASERLAAFDRNVARTILGDQMPPPDQELSADQTSAPISRAASKSYLRITNYPSIP